MWVFLYVFFALVAATPSYPPPPPNTSWSLLRDVIFAVAGLLFIPTPVELVEIWKVVAVVGGLVGFCGFVLTFLFL